MCVSLYRVRGLSYPQLECNLRNRLAPPHDIQEYPILRGSGPDGYLPLHKSAGFIAPPSISWFHCPSTNQLVSLPLHQSVGFIAPPPISWFHCPSTNQLVSLSPHQSAGFIAPRPISLVFFSAQYMI